MDKAIVVVAALALCGCVSRADDETAGPANDARFALADAQGRSVAQAELDEQAGGVRVRLSTTAMPAGVYGLHFHMVGRCDAPAFESAGAHWNPTGARHGRDNPAGAHLGDLPNLTVGADGRGSVTYSVSGATIAGGANPLRDADGSALMIHAAADDYRTDPSGNSGARIACGVVPR